MYVENLFTYDRPGTECVCQVSCGTIFVDLYTPGLENPGAINCIMDHYILFTSIKMTVEHELCLLYVIFKYTSCCS